MARDCRALPSTYVIIVVLILDACICSYSLICIFHLCLSETVFVVACDRGFQDVYVLSHYLLMMV